MFLWLKSTNTQYWRVIGGLGHLWNFSTCEKKKIVNFPKQFTQKLTSGVRETRVSRHNGGSIEGSLEPHDKSAVMVREVSGEPSIRPPMMLRDASLQ